MSLKFEHTLHEESPQRYRVVILGGGVHGMGVLHDLASRGWKDVLLLERSEIGSGTSSRSTKLIHGGLRYLQRVSGFGLVHEALRERRLLMDVAPDLTRPLKFCFPIFRDEGYPGFYVRTGLFLYDFLAGRKNIAKHAAYSREKLSQEMGMLDLDRVSRAYSFWDTQTDDRRLVERIAESASILGAKIATGCQATKIQEIEDGFQIGVKKANGDQTSISALYVVNAMGPWANEFLADSGIVPKYEGFNNKGIHIVVPNLGHDVGAYLQSPEDKRIFFILPWYNYSVIGTTESNLDERADSMQIGQSEIRYLLDRCNRYLKTHIQEKDIITSFAGLRWLAREKGMGISSTSREHKIGFHSSSSRGQLLTLYGGKLTTYRSLSEKIGDYICRDFGEFTKSQTDSVDYWAKPGTEIWSQDDQSVLTRFQEGGSSFTPISKSF